MSKSIIRGFANREAILSRIKQVISESVLFDSDLNEFLENLADIRDEGNWSISTDLLVVRFIRFGNENDRSLFPPNREIAETETTVNNVREVRQN